MDLRETINTKKKHSSVPKSVVTRVSRPADNDKDLRRAAKVKKSPKKAKRKKSKKRGLARGEAALQGEAALRSRKRRRSRREDNDEEDQSGDDDDVAERKVRYVERSPDPEQEDEPRAASPASSSSLSLSPSPSPERRPPSPLPPPRSRNYRSRSPSSSGGGRSRYSRSPPRPPVRRQSHFEEPWRDRDDRRPPRRYSYDDSVSWESKVERFMQNLQKRTPTPPKDDPVETASTAPLAQVDEKEVIDISESPRKDPKPPGVEEEEDEHALGPEEDVKVTPLVRFVGKKLSDAGDGGGGKKRKKKKGAITLRLEGVFQYSLVSLLSRAEWVAAKSIGLLEEAGYPEGKMSVMAMMRGGLALETDLKSAVFTGKVKLGNKPELVHQVLKVIEYVVRYFTAKDGDADSSEEDEESEAEEQSGENGLKGGNALRRGMGETLKQLAVEEDVKADRQRREAEEAEAALPKQPPINPWRLMEDKIQSEALRSLDGIKTHVAKTMLRLGDEKLCEAGRAFDVAQGCLFSSQVPSQI